MSNTPIQPAPPQAPSDLQGLSEADAQSRLAAEGYNELPQGNRRTPLRIVIEVLREPMLALLLVGGAIYLALGDVTEALILLVFASLSVVITVVQETRTERVLDALRDLSSPRALVIRDGERKRIAGREVVRDDLLVVAEGDRVPADALLLRAHDLQADESLLTGESVPVRKLSEDIAAAPLRSGSGDGTARPGGDDLPYIYSGSLIVRGNGIARATATGPRTEIGRIGQTLSALESEPPRLQAQTRVLVRWAAIGGVTISVAAVLLYGSLRGSWLDAVLAGIALGMSMLPEEIPVVLTVFLAMGAWRISRARVLTRRAAAIETLGAATVLCTDKTGTLTQNRMRVAQLRMASADGFEALTVGEVDLPERFHALAHTGRLACAVDPADPMEKAFHALARERLTDGEAAALSQSRLVQQYPLRPDLLAMSNVWQSEDEDAQVVVAAKGAPEAIALLCHLDETRRAAMTRAVEAMATDGMRVLGVAQARHSGELLPDSQRDFAFEFLGLVGLADPLRPGVPEAIAECRASGIRVVMITGDYPATAQAIARQAGLDADTAIGGDALARMSDAELAVRVREVQVFARIMPDQKLRIVSALKANGEIVGMTGDGVNDAPSLKAAHIGIAMGARGTDVAREASSIVLLDDDFGSIVEAVRLGRRIYDNLRKAMAFIFAVHVPIAGLALLPLVFGLPILFGPIHIAFLEMVIDPVSSLVFEAEAEEDDVMRRPPRAPDAPLFSRALIAWSVLQGAVAFALVAGILVVARYNGISDTEIRALAFFSLVLTILGLVFVNRSFSASVITAMKRRNPALRWVLIAVATMLSLTMLVPAVRELFRFGPLHLDDLAVTLGAGVAVLVLLDLTKPIWRKALVS